jgi:hypothetical protein
MAYSEIKYNKTPFTTYWGCWVIGIVQNDAVVLVDASNGKDARVTYKLNI